MDRENLEEYLQEILEKVEMIVKAKDENTLADLTSYIHISKEIIKQRLISEDENEGTERAYFKIKEAEKEIYKLSQTNPGAPFAFLLNDILNLFKESLNEFLEA